MKEQNWKRTGMTCVVTAEAAVLCSAILCMLLAWMIRQEWVSPELCASLVPLLSTACLFGACSYTAGGAKRYRLQICAATAAMYLLSLLIWKALQFSGDAFIWNWQWLLPAVAALSGGLLASRPRTRRH